MKTIPFFYYNIQTDENNPVFRFKRKIITFKQMGPIPPKLLLLLFARKPAVVI